MALGVLVPPCTSRSPGMKRARPCTYFPVCVSPLCSVKTKFHCDEERWVPALGGQDGHFQRDLPTYSPYLETPLLIDTVVLRFLCTFPNLIFRKMAEKDRRQSPESRGWWFTYLDAKDQVQNQMCETCRKLTKIYQSFRPRRSQENYSQQRSLQARAVFACIL